MNLKRRFLGLLLSHGIALASWPNSGLDQLLQTRKLDDTKTTAALANDRNGNGQGQCR